MSTKEKFTSISPAEFFKRNPELAGFSNPARAIYQTVRELVENSLDATDVHELLPSIKVVIDNVDAEKSIYKINIEDNGIGIPPHVVPDAFGRVLYSSKYVIRQTRGMYGLGVKAAVLYSQMYQERPVEIFTSPVNSKRIYSFKLKIDVNRNEPIILERTSTDNQNGWHGTSVSIYLLGDWMRSKSRVYDYVKKTYIITPYAEFVLKDPEGNVFYYQRLTTKIPKPPEEVKPHPYGVDIELIKNMIASKKQNQEIKDFLMKSFQSIGDTTASKLLEMARIDPQTKISKLSDQEISRLVEVMKKFEGFRAPSSEPLSIIGEDLIQLGLKQIFNPEFVSAVSRSPKAYQGHPFIVEVGIAYGGSIPEGEEPTVLRYANKIPLIYDEKSDVIWKVVSETEWRRYGIEGDKMQLVVMVHLCSTKVPYKSAGKESIAEVEEIEKEIKNGIMEVSRQLKTYLSEKKKEEEAKKKFLMYIKYVPEVSRSLSKFISNKDQREYQKEIEDQLFTLVAKKIDLRGIEEYRKIYKVEEL